MPSLHYDTVYILTGEAHVGQKMQDGSSVELELHVPGPSTQKPGLLLVCNSLTRCGPMKVFSAVG